MLQALLHRQILTLARSATPSSRAVRDWKTRVTSRVAFVSAAGTFSLGAPCRLHYLPDGRRKVLQRTQICGLGQIHFLYDEVGSLVAAERRQVHPSADAGAVDRRNPRLRTPFNRGYCGLEGENPSAEELAGDGTVGGGSGCEGVEGREFDAGAEVGAAGGEDDSAGGEEVVEEGEGAGSSSKEAEAAWVGRFRVEIVYSHRRVRLITSRVSNLSLSTDAVSAASV